MFPWNAFVRNGWFVLLLLFQWNSCIHSLKYWLRNSRLQKCRSPGYKHPAFSRLRWKRDKYGSLFQRNHLYYQVLHHCDPQESARSHHHYLAKVPLFPHNSHILSRSLTLYFEKDHTVPATFLKYLEQCFHQLHKHKIRLHSLQQSSVLLIFHESSTPQMFPYIFFRYQDQGLLLYRSQSHPLVYLCGLDSGFLR